MMATMIGVDGTREEVELPRDLDGLQALVGGLIEFIDFQDGTAMMVNEEGKLIGLPENDAATREFLDRLTTWKRHEEWMRGEVAMWEAPDIIVGPAVLLTADENRAMREEG